MPAPDVPSRKGLEPPARTTFPADGRRIVFYLLHDAEGVVDAFIIHKLSSLRPHADHIFVVVNGTLTPESRSSIDAVADTVWERENVGFDVWGYKEALARVGDDLEQYDELILMNYTFFAPVRPFAGLFERVDAESVDFWGITDHASEEPNPFTGVGVLHRHIQSHWIAVRRSMFLSEPWREYWHTMPMITGYQQSVLEHEARFTHHFEDLGFRSFTAFPSSDYPSGHPALFNGDLLVRDGCPILKRRPLFHYPPFLDRHAVIGRWNLAEVRAAGYPLEYIWSNLARTVQPRLLFTNAALLEILPDSGLGDRPTVDRSIGVLLRVGDAETARELVARISASGVNVTRLVIVSPSRTETMVDFEEALVDLEDLLPGVDITLKPGQSRDDSTVALWREMLDPGRFTFLLKIDATEKDEYLRRHSVDNLLATGVTLASAVDLFRREPSLGMLVPSTPHTSTERLGRGWGPHRPAVEALCRTLDVHVPLDDVSPLGPFTGSWLGRTEALARIRTAPDQSQLSAGRRAREEALELSLVYVAGSDGYHTRAALTPSFAALSHTALEEKVDQLSSTTPGYPLEQIQLLHRAGWLGRGGVAALMRVYLRLHRPRLARAFVPVNNLVRRGVYQIRAVRHRLTERSPVGDDVVLEEESLL